ncbi:CGNR zinc finger domain-containing protein [Frondihabitans australicus]|uniref:CGNR zinc finger domain-containing protein n=1 Tax=Frondihabitans australicus TaxID=386892 RepID=UPI001FEB7771|nr:CGNR zinc finger domain-containing protein [Frondihabitans australicus]
MTFAVDLGNTAGSASRSGLDEIETVEQLAPLLLVYSGRIDGDEAELRAVRETRDLLREVWSMSRDRAVTAVNAMLRDAQALPQLVRHDMLDWHLHATSQDAPLDERIRVEVALGMVDVIRADEWWRLRVCAADDCAGLLCDLSRNGSKRFCSVRCGNRMNMVAFRSRAAAAEDESDVD